MAAGVGLSGGHVPFPGFTADSLSFLGDLADHNDRSWFAENRGRYERELLGREREFVEAVGAAFAGLDPRVHAVPVINQSIFRINRDTRFSRDKSPYKTYADMLFWVGDDRKSGAAYFLRLEAMAVSIGGGAHIARDEQLARFRSAIVDEVEGGKLAGVLADLEGDGFEIGEPERKTVPKGFSAHHPRAELLKHTDLHPIRRFSPPPAEFLGPEFVGWSMAQFSRVRPLVDWLAEHLGGAVTPATRT